MNLDNLRLMLAFGPKGRSEFYDILGNFVADGMPAYQAVLEIHKRLVIDKSPLVMVTDRVMQAMKGGAGQAVDIGPALGHLVPPVEAMAIDAGTRAGKMSEGFMMAKRLCDTTAQARAMIRGAMLYPLVLCVFFLGFFIFIGTSMLPVMDDLLPRKRWPANAQALGWMGDHSVIIVVILAAVIGGITAFYLKTKRNWTGGGRDFLDQHVFPWNVACSINGALLLAAIAVMLKASVSFNDILNQLGKSSGEWERHHFKIMRARLIAGKPEGEALATELFHKSFRWQIELYGRVHNFADGIDKLSQRVVERILAQVKARFALVGNLLMGAIAIMVVWTYTSFLSLAMAVRSA